MGGSPLDPELALSQLATLIPKPVLTRVLVTTADGSDVAGTRTPAADKPSTYVTTIARGRV
ncbi:hypothetical protein [Kribbella sp. NBC_00889]|uniref:hypothetical protein n=1 Tax=Kribbella sp. NBC_00889 TaxID=2975974 RepID=UPI00386D0A90|nr:hypothetical protein OG817_13060 [Kribbella sp. NBC_00889]